MNRRNFLKAVTVLSTFLPFGLGRVKAAPSTSKDTSKSADLSLLLDCIAQVESGGDDGKVSSTGARSKYQISRIAWEQHSCSPHWYATAYPWVATSVAKEHITWLLANIGPTIIGIAIAWRVGLTAWQTVRFNASHTDYANRVSYLYYYRLPPT